MSATTFNPIIQPKSKDFAFLWHIPKKLQVLHILVDNLIYPAPTFSA